MEAAHVPIELRAGPVVFPPRGRTRRQVFRSAIMDPRHEPPRVAREPGAVERRRQEPVAIHDPYVSCATIRRKCPSASPVASAPGGFEREADDAREEEDS